MNTFTAGDRVHYSTMPHQKGIVVSIDTQYTAMKRFGPADYRPIPTIRRTLNIRWDSEPATVFPHSPRDIERCAA